MLAQLPADEYPHLARVGKDLIKARSDYRREFGFGLDLILDGLDRLLGETARSPRRR